MSVDRVLSYALITAVISLGPVACHEQQIRNKDFRNAVKELLSHDLTQVSESLAIIDAEDRLQKLLRCRASVQVDGDSSAAYRERALCEAYSQATEEMSTIVRDALASKKRPTDAYAFYLWNAPNDLHECDTSPLYPMNECELLVGLFSRLETCQKAEAAVRSSGEGTRQCRNWNTEEFYEYDRHH